MTSFTTFLARNSAEETFSFFNSVTGIRVSDVFATAIIWVDRCGRCLGVGLTRPSIYNDNSRR